MEPTPARPPSDAFGSIGVLTEPSRRALYDYVTECGTWVSRDQAANAIGVQRGIAAHHLDRLVEAGLLEFAHRRLTDRAGPGAGRPAKVYRRASTVVSVSLPPRRYELAGQMLASAADAARRGGTDVSEAIENVCRDEGRLAGRRAREGLGRRASIRARRDAVVRELRSLGFEPHTRDDGVTVLRNCPFHDLAQTHSELICGMNLCFLRSLLSEVDGARLHAELAPDDHYCCVRFLPSRRTLSRGTTRSPSASDVGLETRR